MSKLYKTPSKFFILLLSIFSVKSVFADAVVTNTNSSGPGSLAQAITDCNNNPGADVITFNIPDGGPTIINLTSALPTITQALFINGYSQPNSLAGPIASRVIRININGAGLPGGDIFTIQSSDVTIAGLAIYNSKRMAINILQNSSVVHIWGNYIGTDSTGIATGLGNSNDAIASNYGILGGSPNTGIVIGIKDNDAVPDANEGNLICSTLAGGSGEGDGIALYVTTTSVIAGNIIGLNKNGQGLGFGNARHGILLTVGADQNIIGTNGNGVSDVLEGNRIARNSQKGILILKSISNVIAGNKIGLDALNAAAGNNQQGIYLMNSSSTRIGTDGLGPVNANEANIICNNGSHGIMVSSEDFFGINDNSNNNTIAGNGIGTDLAGTLVAGNGGSGIFLSATLSGFTTSNNIIGSNFDNQGDAEEGNIISNNANSGIVTGTPAVVATGILNNKFARNRIFNNNNGNGLGIDLNNDGVTSNDNGDADVGPNTLFNFPVITSLQVNGSNELIVQGFSRPGSVIEFYIADAGPHPNPLPNGYTKSFGQSATYLFRGLEDGTLNGITDDSVGKVGTYTAAEEGTGTGGLRTENKFSFKVPIASLGVPVSAGSRITAFAYENTTGTGNTSEFGPVMAVVTTPVTLISFTANLSNGKTNLTWKTTEEINNSHFEIEKSTNGTDYSTIGSVPGKGGHGINTYTYVDNDVTAKINYYRLKQVDIDGRPTYSKVLVVRGDLVTLAAKLSPNPFDQFINISYKLDRAESIQARLYSTSGAMVKAVTIQGNAGTNTFSFSDLGFLPAGNYLLELKGDQLSFRQQVLKK